MILRDIYPRLKRQLSEFPAVVLTGPRQSGKTTLARMLAPEKPYFNFEMPSTTDLFLSDPIAFLNATKQNGAIFDEVQNVPQLLRYLQQEIDENRQSGRFLLTGSQNLLLSQQVSQSLAGRTAIEILYPCTLSEVPVVDSFDYWSRIFSGSYPEPLSSDINTVDWNQSYIQTYLERDVRQLKNIGNLTLFRAFLKACAARTSQLINKKQLADDLGISDTSVSEWLSLLEASYAAFLLPPWIPSVSKRYSHATKLVFIDSGVATALLGFISTEDISRYAFSGFIFESWVTSEIIKTSQNQGLRYEFFYARNYRGAEIDLIAKRGSELIGIEIKSAKTFSHSLLSTFDTFTRSGVTFTKKVLIWGGKERINIQGVDVIPWDQTNSVFDG